ncbi:hypothetical protein DPMN_134703, partial [Dreissena polymorpha]
PAPSRQLTCYKCDEMSDLKLCDTVQQCDLGERCMVQHGNSQYSSGCASVLCKTVRPCYKGELCSIEEFDWLGQSHFKLGCVTATCSAIEHGRSVPRCKSCCSEDFCNTNCTMSHNHGASIIG